MAVRGAQWSTMAMIQYWLVPLLNDTNFKTTTVLRVSGRSAAATRTCTSWFSLIPPSQRPPRRMLLNVYLRHQCDTNLDVSIADIPLTNITDTTPGPLNVQYYVPVTVPLTSVIGAGGGVVFVASGLDTSFTAASAPAPVNLTSQGKNVPWLAPRVAAASSNSSSGSGNGAAGAREGMVGATVLGALLAGVAALLLARADYASS
ncbi:hypothetical protein EDB89DRAFT_2230862 [Lactarius sanguifluus]|nr:hypothetical protein EDB89DRAFT_2230862 [Lactarius sanguifluus]